MANEVPASASSGTPATPNPAQKGPPIESSRNGDGKSAGDGTNSAPKSAQKSSNADVDKRFNSIARPKTGKEANIDTHEDYYTRKAKLNGNNNRQKVALVGRTGKGSSELTGSGAMKRSITGDKGEDVLSTVIFEATPELSEAGQTMLVDIGDIRAAASIVIYMGSPARLFTLSATFVSRTIDEATTNMNYINILKAWREPTLTLGNAYNAEPETLRLYAYGDVFNGIPVMLSSITVEYPSDVDYIMTKDAKWIPIVQKVSLTLKEVRSFSDLATFDYAKFKSGNLPEW